MSIIIEINTDNAAFAEMVGPELADALRILADQIEGMEDAGEADGLRVSDTNGNTVGRVFADNEDVWLQVND
jgi:hypothetical protein